MLLQRNIYFYYKKMRIFSSTIILIIIYVGTNWFPLKKIVKKKKKIRLDYVIQA